jgi:hypothetical protein
VWPTGPALPGHEYGDRQINNKTTDDSLPSFSIVVSQKNKISDEKLKMILRLVFFVFDLCQYFF